MILLRNNLLLALLVVSVLFSGLHAATHWHWPDSADKQLAAMLTAEADAKGSSQSGNDHAQPSCDLCCSFTQHIYNGVIDQGSGSCWSAAARLPEPPAPASGLPAAAPPVPPPIA